MVETHEARISRTRQQYREAHDRLVARLSGVPVEAAERPPADGGWSAAQIGWHVAAVDAAFAALISGARPSLSLPKDFTERSWQDIAETTPVKLEATGPSVPPEVVTLGDALAALDASAQKVDAALQGLTPERGARFGVTHRSVGTVSLYQVGEWAVVHTIRHNAQAKRVLGI